MFSNKSNDKLVTLFNFISQVSSVIAVFFGCLILINSVLPEEKIPNIVLFDNTLLSFAFIFSGISLWLSSKKLTNKANVLRKVFALGIIVTLIAAYIYKVLPLTIMVNFFIIGLALLLINVNLFNKYRPTEFLVLISIFFSMLGFIGFAYGATSLYKFSLDPYMSAMFTVLSLGILCARPEAGIMSLVSSNYAGGFMIRMMLLVVILVSLLIGISRLIAQQTGIFYSQFSILIIVGISIAMVSTLFITASSFLDMLDVKRTVAEEEIQLLNKNLETKITERTGELREINKRLKVAMKALEHRAEELENSRKEAEQFAYIASHDLREPLDVIAGYIKLLEKRYKNNLDQNANEFINYIVDAVDRMRNLISDLLRYSKHGTHVKSLKLIDCTEVVKTISQNLQTVVNNTHGNITFDSLPLIMVDSSQLSQLFQNLISNALKFHGKDPPKVHVSASRNDNKWVFSVSDNGIGIDPVYADRIFNMFERLHSTTEYPGSGIGLAICKKIVESYGGQIWVKSEPKKGSEFYFTLPVID